MIGLSTAKAESQKIFVMFCIRPTFVKKMIFFRKSSVRLNVGILEKLVKILSLQQYNPVNISCKGRDVYGDEVRSGIVRC